MNKKFDEWNLKKKEIQLRLIDSKRLIRKIGMLGETKFNDLRESLKKVIFD